MYVYITWEEHVNLSQHSQCLVRDLKAVLLNGGTAVAQWLRHCATNWKVAGSIPDDVIGIFDIILPIALWSWGSTHPLTEMNTRSIFWV
jgi:hypothetical protein